MSRGLVFVFLLAIGAVLPLGGETVTQGGPSSFGYDASSACGQPFSRYARSSFQNLPCDFRRENWCTIAGNAYPWQAVRKFVQENQGLMRRMYGDEKHISVLKTELDKNDVELELEDDHNHLYSEDASSLFKQFHFEVDYEFDGSKSARSLNTGTSSKFDDRRSDDSLIGYRSHPNETPTAGSTTHSSSSAAPVTWTTSRSSNKASPTNGKTSFSHRTRISSVASSTNRRQSTTSIPLRELDEDPRTASGASVVSLAQITKSQNLSINEIHGQIDRLEVNAEELTKIPEILTETTLESRVDGFDEEISTVRGVLTSSERVDEGKDAFDDYDRKPQQDDELDESRYQEQEQEQFRPRPEYTSPDAVKPETADSTKGQLFQDVAAKDKQDPPVLKVRGTNACTVKEEVVAPFWANNTRGEVLALLNLYPFEQYVHWEKCTQENKQMYCRDGCRCEQQYRLHRLLAYDPNNECRGIFSDWFKFPSCCICRCYDLPVEFWVTSRSPRLLHRQRLKVRAPGLPPRQRRNSHGHASL